MRENKYERQQSKKLDIIISWISRHWISAMDRGSKLVLTTYFFNNDRTLKRDTAYISNKELANSVSLIVLSAAVSGAGIQQFIIEIFRGHP